MSEKLDADIEENLDETSLSAWDSLSEVAFSGAEQAEATPAELLDRKSHENISRELNDFVDKATDKGVFDTADEAVIAVSERASEYALDHKYTINMTTASIERFLMVGHAETFWDHLEEAGNIENMARKETTNGKPMTPSYIEARRTAEGGLSQYVDKSKRGKHPIYATLASGQEDYRKGACPAYGNWAILIGDSFEDNTLYSFTDSFQATAQGDFSDKHLLCLQDALTAKAIHSFDEQMRDKDIFYIPNDSMRNRNHAGYVEAEIYDDVTTENIEGLSCGLYSLKDLSELARLLPKIQESQVNLNVNASFDMPVLLQSYLEKNLGLTNDKDETLDAELVAQVWQDLGVDINSEPSQISEVIEQKVLEFWDSISRRFVVKSDFITYPRKQIIGLKWNDVGSIRRKYKKDLSKYPAERVDPQDVALFEKLLQLKECQAFFGQFQTEDE